MKAKILAIFMISAMLFCMIPSAVTAAGFSANVGKEEIPYGPENPDVQAYAPNGFNMMTTAEAAAAGVPAGYTGDYVLALTGLDAAGIMLDKRVPFASVESVTFRIFCPDNVKEFRITDCKGTDWIARVVPAETNAWIEITFSPTSDNFYTENVNHGFYEFEGADGYFKPVNVGFRFNDASSETTVYIDSITFDMGGSDVATDDTEAPVIDFAAASIAVPIGTINALEIEATDNSGEAYVVMDWSENTFDSRGRFAEGQHTLTVTATDLSGNTSTTLIIVLVSEDVGKAGDIVQDTQ